MNEFEDLIDMLLIEQPGDTSETVIETICETNDDGEVVCETITGDNGVIGPITELQSSSDQEQDEIEQVLPTMFDSYIAPIYSAFSFINALNPYDLIFQLETGADDADVLLELNVDGSVDDGALDFYDDETVEQVYFMELGDASDVMNTVENGDVIFILETDDDAIDPCEFGYFGPSNADVYFYSEAIGEYDPYYYGNYQYDQYDNEIMYDQDEFEFEEVSRWQDQVLGELVFVVLALVLVKVVLFCKRSRSRPASDRTTPLLTVAVEQQESTDADTGSYIPPKATTVKKAVFAEKLDKEPYIVFI